MYIEGTETEGTLQATIYFIQLEAIQGICGMNTFQNQLKHQPSLTYLETQQHSYGLLELV